MIQLLRFALKDLKSNKQHCPKCNVPITDIGTCPIVKPVLILNII